MIFGLRSPVLALLVVAMSACSSGPGRPEPTPLQSFAPQIQGVQAWQARLGDIDFALSIASDADSVTLATSGGDVVALAANDGRELWRGTTGEKLSAGVGSDGRYASVVTRGNEVVVFDSGKLLWRARLDTRVVTAPLVAGERVFVLGVDRSVQAFDVLDGRRLWAQPRSGDPLTLLQPGVLLPWQNTLVVGQGPRLVGLDPLSGASRWDVAVASPRGTNEVERLADLVGPAARVGNTVCARAFQSAVGCVDAARGALTWTKNVGGANGVAADQQWVFAADASDRITAWRRESGEVAWTSDDLRFRTLSPPLVHGRTLVLGDYQGQLHFLDRESGRPLLRLPTDGNEFVGAPVKSGPVIVAVTRNGGVFAFRTE
jgi:outer membrane assembly lipoprotein YfgL